MQPGYEIYTKLNILFTTFSLFVRILTAHGTRFIPSEFAFLLSQAS